MQAELDKLILGDHPPVDGIECMVETGLAERVLPEIPPALKLEIDEHHQHKDVYWHSLTVLQQAIGLEDGDPPDPVLRWAALLHDIGKPGTKRNEAGGGVSFHHHEVVGAKLVRKRMKALKYSKQMVEDVGQLVYLHLRFHGYGKGQWTDSAVRRYVHDAGHLLPRLHKLVRADCTTRNKRRAAALQATYDDLEKRIVALAEKEDMAKVRPPTSTGTRSWRSWGSRPDRRSVRPGTSSRNCVWTAARSNGTRPRPSCADGGPSRPLAEPGNRDTSGLFRPPPHPIPPQVFVSQMSRGTHRC